MKTNAQIICQRIELPATPGGCWEWRGIRNPQTGYGTTRTHRADGVKRTANAHRAAYELFVGQVPAGLQLDHVCRNRGCVNPAHLEVVTGRENCRRGESPAAQCAKQTHCKNGHPFNAENTYHRPANGRPGRHCRRCANDSAMRRYYERTA